MTVLGSTPNESNIENSTNVLLGAGGIFTGAWVNVVDWTTISISTLGTNVTDGVLWIDVRKEGETLINSVPFERTNITSNPSNVPALWNIVEGEFRVRYVNGTTPQLTEWWLETKLSNGQQMSLISAAGGMINDSTPVTPVKAVLSGKDDNGNYHNSRFTPSGNFAVSLFDSETGSRQIVDFNGAAKTGEAFVLSGGVFYGQDLNPIHWETQFVGSGSELPLPGTHRINTGVTANSKSCLQTVRTARFMMAQFNIAHFGIQLNTADLTDVDCIRKFGVFDPISVTENGLFMEVTSIDGINPQWYTVAIKNGVETQRTAQQDWNGASASSFDPTATVAAYEIQYNAGTAFFFQGSKFLHQVRGVPVYAGTYNFKVGLSIENINGNTIDNVLDFRSAGVYRLGEPKGDPIGRAFTANTLVKNGTGFISQVSLTRTGSAGGSGSVDVYDGLDNTGFLIGRIDVGGDDLKGITINGTFSEGLYIELAGSGTNTVNLSFE